MHIDLYELYIKFSDVLDKASLFSIIQSPGWCSVAGWSGLGWTVGELD